MKIDELDEFQGITSEMIQAWLLANGWKQVEQMAYQLDAPPVRTGWLFRRGDETVGTGADISYVLANLSRLSCKTPQALLREINPRMRKGMPSKAAREAHGFKGGMWVGSRGEAGSGGTLVFVSFDDSSSGLPLTVWDFSEFDTWEVGQSEIDDEWLFWPADESGNKIRWYTDAEGNML